MRDQHCLSISAQLGTKAIAIGRSIVRQKGSGIARDHASPPRPAFAQTVDRKFILLTVIPVVR